MPPHLRIGRDLTVANFGASHKQPTAPGRSFGHFFHLPSTCLPTSHNGIPSSQPLGAGSLWATTARSATFPSVQNDLRAPPAQRDDGDRHALPSRHRLSQAAAAPAVVAGWQSAWAHLPTMASVCRAPDASTLWCSGGSILRGSCFSNVSVNLLFTI